MGGGREWGGVGQGDDSGRAGQTGPGSGGIGSSHPIPIPGLDLPTWIPDLGQLFRSCRS